MSCTRRAMVYSLEQSGYGRSHDYTGALLSLGLVQIVRLPLYGRRTMLVPYAPAWAVKYLAQGRKQRTLLRESLGEIRRLILSGEWFATLDERATKRMEVLNEREERIMAFRVLKGSGRR